MKRLIIFYSATAALLLNYLPLSADYTIVLKNGRRFNVQNFREEAGIVKLHGFGGEISIPKDQIQTIKPAVGAKSPTEAPLRSAPVTVPGDGVPAQWARRRRRQPELRQGSGGAQGAQALQPDPPSGSAGGSRAEVGGGRSLATRGVGRA